MVRSDSMQEISKPNYRLNDRWKGRGLRSVRVKNAQELKFVGERKTGGKRT